MFILGLWSLFALANGPNEIRSKKKRKAIKDEVSRFVAQMGVSERSDNSSTTSVVIFYFIFSRLR
jgi:hypothetical protein